MPSLTDMYYLKSVNQYHLYLRKGQITGFLNLLLLKLWKINFTTIWPDGGRWNT